MPDKIRIDGDALHRRRAKEFAEGLIEKGKQGRKEEGVVERARRFDKYYNGQHRIKNQNKIPQKVYNRFADIADQQVARMAAVQPKYIFTPRGEDDVAKAQALNVVIGDVLWDRSKWRQRGEDAVLEAYGSGSCHSRVGS